MTRPRHRRRSLWTVAMAAATLTFLSCQLPPYLILDSARPRIPARFPLHDVLHVGHIGLGTVALVTMCLQMWPRPRRNRPVFHRWSGRVPL